MFKTPKQMGIEMPQIIEICETLWSKVYIKDCHDCGVKPGEQHDTNCDVSRCTWCGHQRLSCECVNGDTEIWTGIWPGIQECYDKHLICYDTCTDKWMFDLNEFYNF